MQSHIQTQPDPHLTRQIPWWNDLDSAALAELELPDIRSLPAQTVDVVVIGGGVAGPGASFFCSPCNRRASM